MSMTGVRIDFLGGFGGTFSKGLIYRIGVLGMEPVTEYQESNTGYEDHKSDHTNPEGSTTRCQSLIMFTDL
jgi:hypothetical protein